MPEPKQTASEIRHSGSPTYEGHPWEKMPGESPTEFTYFRAYRDMPTNTRAVSRVAEAYDRTRQYIESLSAKNKWVFRVDQWEGYLSVLAVQEIAKTVRAHARRHRALATRLIEAAELATGKLLEQMQQEGTRVTVRGTVLLTTEAVKLHRMLLEANDAITRQEGESIATPQAADYSVRAANVISILRSVGALSVDDVTRKTEPALNA